MRALQTYLTPAIAVALLVPTATAATEETVLEVSLRVVGIVLNSGTPDDVTAWVAHFQPEYDVWVYENASLGDLVGSHLVPTYLFVDEDGRMKGKLVGHKESESVSNWVGRMLAAGASATRR